MVINGKKIAQDILQRLARNIRTMRVKPHLAVVLVGEDKPSLTYVRKKQQAAMSVEIKFSLFQFPETVSEQKLIAEIRRIQSLKLHGIIIQLPLPRKFDKKRILNELDSSIDVDCLSWESLGKLVVGDSSLVPPSPGAILEILKYHKVNLTGKHVVLVGQGDLIGKPLTNVLIRLPLTLTTCNKQTKNLGQITREADILITATGQYNLIRGNMVKKGAVVIDAGVGFKDKKMHGDINFQEVAAKASLVTPTPGGVGPITVAKLLENTYLIAKKNK